ncbi:hypothetical protein [Streptomyces sp. NPDC089799]|uniref:hypothetical protein n=1 Tax=Streptomyces sp. NPDC089799 TaxID=3155066 RepID=UPI003418296E
MADDRNRWLDSAAAERLLRGEPAGPVADHLSDGGAARLRAVLDELAAAGAPADSELPGEAAALAAFRTVHGPAGAEPEHEAESVDGRGAARGPLVALGRPAVHRPVRNHSLRLGLAAAAASVALGGVAAAAGSGLFNGTLYNTADPRPAVSVTTGPSSSAGERADGGATAPVTPEGGHSRLRDNDRSGTQGTGGTPTGPGAGSGQPGNGTDGSGGHGFGEDGFGEDGETAVPDRDTDTGTGTDGGARDPGTRMIRVADLCRAHRAGRISVDGRDKLARAAKGILGIDRFCDRLLNGDPDPSGGSAGSGTGGKNRKGSGGGQRSGDSGSESGSDSGSGGDADGGSGDGSEGSGDRSGTASTSGGILRVPAPRQLLPGLPLPAASGADIRL